MIYENNTNVGTAKVYLQGISSTLGGKKCIGTFAIKPAEIMSTTITVPESVAYDGSKTEVNITVRQVLPQLSVFAFLYYRKYNISNISKDMREAVKCQIHTVHYV